MKYFSNCETLLDIETRLEEEFSASRRIRIMGDLDIDYEDYFFLKNRLREVAVYFGDMQYMDKYRLSQIIGRVFHLRFEDASIIYISDKKRIIERMPQHMLGHVIQMYADIFCEYGFETANINDNSFDGICSIIALQAGMSYNEYENLFHVIENRHDLTIPRLYEENIMAQVSFRMSEMFKYLDREAYCAVLEEICRVYVDARINKLNMGEILLRNMKASYMLVDTFYKLSH